MAEVIKITQQQLNELASATAFKIRSDNAGSRVVLHAYGIPRGGVNAGLAIVPHMLANNVPLRMVDNPHEANFLIDDLIDSGATYNKWTAEYPGLVLYTLINKQTDVRFKDKWIVFPWEHNELGSFEDNVTRLLQFVGEDPSRGGLLETPARVAKAWKHWTSGYAMDPAKVLKTFTDGGETHDQMITVKDIPFYSHCEHHMAPIFGTVTISYIPNGKIVGLSKLSRLADIFARRLQVQERMTDQIADALHKNLEPKGVGVMVKARHLCMESRGVCQQGHHTITTALRGVIKEEAKEEFLRLAQ